MAGANSWWVTWPDTSDGNAAQAGALVWGPQSTPPPQISGMLEAGPFPSTTAAYAYKAAIGTGAILPPPGTPVIGDVQPGSILTGLNAIGDFFQRLAQPNTWLRVAEFTVGGLIIFVAANHLLGNPAGKAAKTAGKAALL